MYKVGANSCLRTVSVLALDVYGALLAYTGCVPIGLSATVRFCSTQCDSQQGRMPCWPGCRNRHSFLSDCSCLCKFMIFVNAGFLPQELWWTIVLFCLTMTKSSMLNITVKPMTSAAERDINFFANGVLFSLFLVAALFLFLHCSFFFFIPVAWCALLPHSFRFFSPVLPVCWVHWLSSEITWSQLHSGRHAGLCAHWRMLLLCQLAVDWSFCLNHCLWMY